MEILKISVSALTPITVAVVGFYLNKRLKSIDDAQWQNRKIVEKRLALFDEIAPNLNMIFCFFVWVGYWKDISPKDVIRTKRELDKFVNIYRHLLGDEFYVAYNDFIHLGFRTYTGTGKDALIRSQISNTDGDRRVHANYKWEDSFEDLFDVSSSAPKREFVSNYERAMIELRKCVGL